MYICAMKLLLRSIVLFLLTSSVLLGSVGVALSKQLCQMAEMEAKKISGKKAQCCEKATDPEERESCCTAEVSYEKLEPVSSLKTFSLEVPVFFAEPLKPFIALQALAITKDQRILTYADSSPPLYGRNLLLQIQTLVV
ncbi:hypothetical protein DP923_13165 [Pontibacter arcticus]|uniref:Uncharacterized protein n=2 Tax=Pontibacter arcticus TaxID=2080288 RepID=A0A364RCL7_9BACT|nr:hypothetical protein DP923_13165 [Pontibacter arcticus]